MTAPCKGCDRRTVSPNCHETCVHYLDFRYRQDEIRRLRESEGEAGHAVTLRLLRIRRLRHWKKK